MQVGGRSVRKSERDQDALLSKNPEKLVIQGRRRAGLDLMCGTTLQAEGETGYSKTV